MVQGYQGAARLLDVDKRQKHNRVAGFIGIRNVRHEVGVYRVASVSLTGVVKIDNVKFWLYLVVVQVVK